MAVDLEFEAIAPWQYAIDPATVKFNAGITSPALASPIFDSGKPPMTISVSACPIVWPIAGNTFASSPPTNPNCTGPATTIKLTPYGVSHSWIKVLTRLMTFGCAGHKAKDRGIPCVQIDMKSATLCWTRASPSFVVTGLLFCLMQIRNKDKDFCSLESG